MLNKRILVLMFVVAFLFVGCFPSVTPPVTENQAPTITSTAITTATIGVAYTYDVNATDPDGDTLTYSLDVKPSGMIINSVTGVIFLTPIAEGVYTVVVKVSDGVLSDTQGFTITVSKPSVPPVNQKPVINSYPITTAIVGETYTYDVNAHDPDSDILTYSIIGVKPVGMTINPANGFIWWTPTSTQIGDNLITVMVSDGALSDTQSFIVKVSEPEPEPEPEPKLTKIVVDPKEMELIVGGFETFEVTAHYDNNTTNIVTFKCHYGTSNPSIAYVAYGIDKVTTLTVGTATIFISYTQHNFLTGGEITKTDEIVVTVIELAGSYSFLWTTSIMDSTDFDFTVGMAPPLMPPNVPNPYFFFHPDLIPMGFSEPIGGSWLFEDIDFGITSEGQTFSVTDGTDFEGFANLLTNGTDEWIWFGYMGDSGNIASAGGQKGVQESQVFSGTDVGTDFPGYIIKDISLTFNQIYLDTDNVDKLVLDYTIDIYAGLPTP